MSAARTASAGAPTGTLSSSATVSPTGNLFPAGTGRLRNGNPPGDLRLARRCGARTRAGHGCGQPAMKNRRCRLHGGKSTGPRTVDGLERSRRARLVHGLRGREYAALRRDGMAIRRRISGLCAEIAARMALGSVCGAGKEYPSPLEGGGEILDACSGLSPVGMGFIVVNRAAGCGGGRDGLDFPGGGHERRGIQRGPALCKDALDGLVQTTPTGAGRTEFRKVIQGTMSPGAGAIPTPGTAPVSWSATPICNSRARCADGCSPTRSRRASGFSCARCGKKKG